MLLRKYPQTILKLSLGATRPIPSKKQENNKNKQTKNNNNKQTKNK